MARLSYLDKDDLKEEDKELLARGINLHRILVHSPGAARAFGALGGYIRHGTTMDARLRELAILQVGWLAKSPYEWSHHVKIGKDFGVTDDDIYALIAESNGEDSGLPGLDRLVLRAAREITNDGAASAESFAALNDQMSKEHVVDLTVTISFYNAVVRFLATLEIDVEDSYQPYLDAFPLPE
ncbi:MAG: carboxymuconolactone decarboxylase family protein [Alphaproteobacteria bacterium]|jgi:alkylhydroperoxidase family enzyme|nr:carboxymuconolactone decarboxylase family protein [Alphaproteobacteria bacterium]